MTMSVVGIDLAKRVFQLHGVDEAGRVVVRKKLTRAKLMAFVSQLEPCVIGMEACGGAHYWGREFRRFGHQVTSPIARWVQRLIARRSVNCEIVALATRLSKRSYGH